ncbi:hypothetical protein AZ270_gp81 [Acidianus tailed spindle virus]|uniref:hypothetical protein n=1 Tax=Acidianus tailed spindle virus TaxID=1797140 RepID=UPI00076F2C5D|nr:hypothetical protein AZ270_gp81 [Acidianus tailed spindle virus]AME30104.1 hypothetical protein ATSV_A192 [Acidianus tailed spindle virus]
MDYCRNNHDAMLECVVSHSPDLLSVFINSYLKNKKAIENSDQKFWESVKKEYEKLWKKWMREEVAYYLGDILVPVDIIQNNELNNACKVGYLKAYEEVLNEFADRIKSALQEGVPLCGEYLYDWYMKMADVVPIKRPEYNEQVSYFLDFYNMFDDSEKLEVLSILLDEIDSALYEIEEEYERNLEALINNNS